MAYFCNTPYFVKNKVTRRSVSLQTVESVDTLETEDGEFVLKKVLAGEHKGMREIGLMDNYMNFSEVLDPLNLSVRLNNGLLHIDGRGKRGLFMSMNRSPWGLYIIVKSGYSKLD